MMNRFYHLLILLLSAALVFGCKKTDLPDNEDEGGISQAQIEQFTKIYEDINPIASAALKAEDPIAALKEVAEKYKGTPGISDIYVDEDAKFLAVEYDNLFRTYWVAFAKPQVEGETITLNNLRSEISSLRIDDYTLSYPKYLYVYTHTEEEGREDESIMMQNIMKVLKSGGVNVTPVYGRSFSVKFLQDQGLLGYDGIFISSHGCYDAKVNATYIMTGQIVTPKEYAKIVKSLGKKRNLVALHDGYISISEHFIDEYYQDSTFPKNSFFYSGCCQTMMDPNRGFAQVLVRKGISLVSGYTESTFSYFSIQHTLRFMNRLLRGDSYNEIMKESQGKVVTYMKTHEGYLPNMSVKHEYPERQEVYVYFIPYQLPQLLYTADLVSYPTDLDFRFDKVLKLDKNYLEIPEGGVGEVTISPIGSGDYGITKHESEPGIVSASFKKGTVVQIKGEKAGVAHLEIKDKVKGRVGMCKVVVKSQQERIDEILPPDQVQIIEDLDMPINKGTNPPIINGCYLASPYVLSRTNIADDFQIGYQFADFTVLFYDQDNTTFNIKLKGWHANSLSTSIETSITSGSDNKFTIYGKVRSDEIDNPSAYTIQAVIYSGEYDNGVIRNFKKAFVMLEKNDPEDKYMPVGSARVVEDGDGISPQVPVPAAAMMRHSGQNQGLSMYIRRR